MLFLKKSMTGLCLDCSVVGYVDRKYSTFVLCVVGIYTVKYPVNEREYVFEMQERLEISRGSRERLKVDHLISR